MSNENKKSENKEQAVKLSEREAVLKKAEEHVVAYLKDNNIEASEDERKELVSRVIKSLDNKYFAEDLCRRSCRSSKT